MDSENTYVVGVDGFDVLADLIGPGGQDLAAVAVGFLTSSLHIFRPWQRSERPDSSHLVAELPCENRRGVFVSGHNLAHIVLEGADDGWISVEVCLRLSRSD